METVASIAAFGSQPGLVAYICPTCGRTKTTLIQASPAQQQQQPQARQDRDDDKE
jgi:hypothetical protein